MIIQPNAPPGHRGVLFDLSSAILLDDGAAAALDPAEPLVSKAFAPRNAFRSERMRLEPHCVDDLESFFYVFCYLTNGYDAYGTDLKVVASLSDKPSSFSWPLFMNEWFDDRGEAYQKENFIRQPVCLYTVHESFSPRIQALMDNWQRFFASIESTKTAKGDFRFVPEAGAAYEKILLCIEDALNSAESRNELQPGEKKHCKKGGEPASRTKRKKRRFN